MVLEALVADRRGDWWPTSVVLEGVAEELVTPKGAVDITVQVGRGEPFKENALVVQHLPGDVEALVSFDTVKNVGLVLGPDRVTVGGEEVVPVAASEAAELQEERLQEVLRAELRLSDVKLGETGRTFRELEACGAVLEVFRGPRPFEWTRHFWSRGGWGACRAAVKRRRRRERR
jgi:hypothetical protein